ncbi:Phosphate transporter pho1-like protein [Thalictrum thalictroides]|uniref:Phosphate transporter pho1-like protein n=1 Tax=Thalictrum thalictroides TaxID=46969 RepID=A0A7J6XBR6_THATH|nr:Phosphate transporter pho1-like protein [Thalictrum thalictroides]
MKFGKEFLSQMVPEWQEVYIDYNYLKSILKNIQVYKLRNKLTNDKQKSLKRKSTMYRAFSGLTNRRNNSTSDIENQVLVVNLSPKDGTYETMFLRPTEEGGEMELLFFSKLDDEFNKVNKFYMTKVEEVRNEAAFLNKQMDALIALRIKVNNHESELDLLAETNRFASNITAASAAVVSTPSPTGAGTSGVTKRYETINEEDCKDLNKEKRVEIKMTARTPSEILNHVKINTSSETPRSTIKLLFKVDKDKELDFRKANLKSIEEQLKRVFIEFYHKLRLLKSYSFLNLTAMSKILKKYDKVTSRTASKAYLNMIDSSYMGNSDVVIKLVERVEATFIKHFSNSNRSNGMNILRLKAKRERHRTTFSFGFFTGCSMALIVALIVIIHARNIMRKEGFQKYMENMFPLYSLFAFIVLHMVMYGGNIYFWKRYRVNYPFIFGYKQGTELGYREVFLLSAGLATLALASVLANLDMEMDVKTKAYSTLTELIPLGLVTFLLLIAFCPFNIIYRSSRFFLLCSLFHCICAPLYKVTLFDFFLADQLTSQVQALRSLLFYICYYGWGDFKQRRNTCFRSDVYGIFTFIVATIPYWSRLFQCLRRFCEDRDSMHIYSGLKYFSTVLALLARIAYRRRIELRQSGEMWWMVALVTSIIATVYNTFWDIVVDWGLLRRHSKNRWLRDKLILPHNSVYFAFMVLNILLRLAWLQLVLNNQVPFLHVQTQIAIVASLEIIRRGIWNFFRLENEHLNNVGKYRAFNSVPLPFNYDENEQRDE